MGKKKLKMGMSFKAKIPDAQFKPMKVHIDHILPSIYEDERLIVYRVFNKHKKYWHELMCTEREMNIYRNLV